MLHRQLHNPLLSNMSNLFSVQCKLEREPGKQDCDATKTRQRGRIPSNHTTRHQTLLALTNPWRSTPGWEQPGIGPFALQRHPVQALMELTDHISQQGRCSQQSRTGQSWWPGAQRPTIKTKARCVAGSLESREEPSLHINLFQTQKLASSKLPLLP